MTRARGEPNGLAARRAQAARRQKIAVRIQQAREAQVVSRMDFALALRAATGVAWTPAMVTKMEQGLRLVTAEELALIAELQARPVDYYLATVNRPFLTSVPRVA